MKDFIQRNSPIFVIGAFIVVIFLIVTVISSIKKQRSPELVPLNQSQISEIDSSNPKEMDIPTAYEVDKKYTPLEIFYSKQGFTPKDTKIVQNQLVKWTNTTDEPVTIVQITKVYPELKDGIRLKPGETFEFRLYKTKLWSYKIEDTELMGTVFVVDN